MLIVAELSVEAIKKYLNYMIGDDIVRQVFIIVFTVLIFNFIFYKIINKLHKKLQLTQNPWDDAFIDAIKLPMRYLVWVIGISRCPITSLNDLRDNIPDLCLLIASYIMDFNSLIFPGKW